MKYKVFSILILILLVAVGVYAQCPMCKMTAETNMKNGGMAGRGLNQGILYLLLLPYLAILPSIFIWRQTTFNYNFN